MTEKLSFVKAVVSAVFLQEKEALQGFFGFFLNKRKNIAYIFLLG